MNESVLGLDFGGTKLAAGIVGLADHTLIAAGQVETHPETGAEGVLQDMLALIQSLKLPDNIRRVGVSFGGHVRANRIVRSLHVPGWDGFPLEQRLIEALGVDHVRIANDANAAALGEWRFGAGQVATSMLYITVSTGIGGGIVWDGRVWEGTQGMAGEIGHLQIVPDGPVCTCGRKGCLEALAAGPAIVRRFIESAADTQYELLSKGPHLTARDVAEAAHQGDAFARQILCVCGADLGRGIATALNLLDVERVVVGGGVSQAGPLWWDAMRAAVSVHTLMAGSESRIVPCALRPWEGVWGAAALLA